MKDQTLEVDQELDELVAEAAAAEAPRRGRTGGGQHLAGMNREQYRKARRTWGHVHGGKHPKGQTTSPRSRLVNRSRTRAAQGTPDRSIRSTVAAENVDRWLEAQVTAPYERLFEVMAEVAGWRRWVESDRKGRQMLDRAMSRAQR